MDVKSEPMDIPKSKVMKAMPNVSSATAPSAPVHYWGGVIYTARKANRFRALREKGNDNSEKQCRWGKQRTAKEAWQVCVKAIEEYHVSKHSKKK